MVENACTYVSRWAAVKWRWHLGVNTAERSFVGTQRVSALPFGTARTQALLATLVIFRLLPKGFRNRDFAPTWRPCWAWTRHR